MSLGYIEQITGVSNDDCSITFESVKIRLFMIEQNYLNRIVSFALQHRKFKSVKA